MEKRILQLVLGILALALIWNTWNPFWRYDLNKAVNSNASEDLIFEVEKGSGAKTIAKNLYSEGLIVNWRSFLRGVEEEELAESLRYGRFILNKSMSLRDVITILTTKGTGEMAITVIEGWTIDDIDAYLTDLGLAEANAFRDCTFTCEFEYDFLDNTFGLEGFLFPDTYFIDSASFSVESFTNRMLRNFDSKFDEELRAAAEAEGRSIHEAVIVASILEKEVQTGADIPIVSGIIWKRLDNDWTLGIDATLLYIQDDNELTAADLAVESPYNTRINTGLPPSAIGNPGLVSLEGAVYPEDSDYWFYLTTPDTGEVIYASTNEEHEANKAQYLK